MFDKDLRSHEYYGFGRERITLFDCTHVLPLPGKGKSLYEFESLICISTHIIKILKGSLGS